MIPYQNIVALHQLWHWYVFQGPGDPRHAASWELCVALINVLEALQPQSVCDTGSGLTSIVVQLWAAKRGAHCVHFDDDATWAEKTREALIYHKLDPDRVSLWPTDGKIGAYDLIVHDLGIPETRVRTMPAVALAARALVVDDLHFDSIRQAALATGRRFQELAHTRDGYGRYAGVSLPVVIA
jgi:hypothetical protein